MKTKKDQLKKLKAMKAIFLIKTRLTSIIPILFYVPNIGYVQCTYIVVVSTIKLSCY